MFDIASLKDPSAMPLPIRAFVSSSLRMVRRRVLPWLAAPLVLGLAACGGGGAIEPFVAARVVALGDDASVVPVDGKKHTVNDFTDGKLDCTKNIVWVQRLANGLAVPMKNCAGISTKAPSISRAAAGARVADVQAQIDAHAASDTFGAKDLFTVYVGVHDILAEFATLTATNEATLVANLQARGKTLGGLVNRIALAGSPVLVVTVPDVGVTPFGRKQEAIAAGRAAVLQRLTSAFNIAMRLEIINDGRLIGLVDAFDLTKALVQNPSFFALTNITDAACATPTPECTTATLAPAGGTPVPYTTYLWADDLQFTPSAHDRLGLAAEGRAKNNPF
jgi:outer membrane lipase/esterase